MPLLGHSPTYLLVVPVLLGIILEMLVIVLLAGFRDLRFCMRRCTGIYRDKNPSGKDPIGKERHGTQLLLS